jgi:hypothetical protein
MYRQPLWILTATLLFGAQISSATPQEHLLAFKLAGKMLSQQGALPQNVSRGHRIVVLIENVADDKPGWTFGFDGNDMEKTGANPLRFEAEVKTEKQLYRLVFRNDSNPPDSVEMTPKMIEILGLPATPKPGNGFAPLKKVYDRRKNEINLYFDQDGLPYRTTFPTDVDDNDIIHIYIVAKQDESKNYSVEITGKFSDADEYSVHGAEALGDLKKLITRGILQGAAVEAAAAQDTVIGYLGAFGPYAAPSITITIKKKDGFSRNYPARINRNYIGSLRFGVAKSRIQFNRYEAKRLAGSDGFHIKNVADPDGELRYFLTAVFYAWRFWEDRFWRGRDIDEFPTLTERFNPLVGIGLKDFGTEYVAGFSLELARGLDMFGGEHFAKVKELDGNYKEGDAFNGEAADIPTKEKWKHQRFLGVSVDLVIAAKVLGSLFGS